MRLSSRPGACCGAGRSFREADRLVPQAKYNSAGGITPVEMAIGRIVRDLTMRSQRISIEKIATVAMATQKVVPVLVVAFQQIIEAGGHGVISIKIEPVSKKRDVFRVTFFHAPTVLIKLADGEDCQRDSE